MDGWNDKDRWVMRRLVLLALIAVVWLIVKVCSEPR